MNTQSTQIIVTRELVPEDRRMDVAERLFGIHFPLQLEPVIYGITERMAKDYTGGLWDFHTLSNGGFYMSLSTDRVFHVSCDNMYEGDLSDFDDRARRDFRSGFKDCKAEGASGW
jgi:hypothetical protein